MIGFKGLRGVYREFAANKNELRFHRNHLIHRIASPRRTLVEKLLGGTPSAPCLAERLLRAIGAALPLGQDAQVLINEVLGDPDLACLHVSMDA